MPARLKVYILGPMRGIPEFNFPAFFEAEAYLTSLGFQVSNPAKMDIERDGLNVRVDQPKAVRHYMRRDLATVCDMDFLYALPGWQSSEGARLEAHAGEVCHIPLFTRETLVPVEIEFRLREASIAIQRCRSHQDAHGVEEMLHLYSILCSLNTILLWGGGPITAVESKATQNQNEEQEQVSHA